MCIYTLIMLSICLVGIMVVLIPVPGQRKKNLDEDNYKHD